jgi:hypothetical protein
VTLNSEHVNVTRKTASRITLEAPPVRSWAVDGLLDSLVAPTLPPADKTERARRQADWNRQAAATTKVCIVHTCSEACWLSVTVSMVLRPQSIPGSLPPDMLAI